MLAEPLVGSNIVTTHHSGSQVGQLALQAAGQHGKTHDLDEPDVLFLDVVLVGMGMEHTQGMFIRSDVAAQHQIQLVVLPSPAGDGSDGVVGFAVREGDDAHGLIGVAPPGVQDLLTQVGNAAAVSAGETDDAHGPLDDTGGDVLIARKLHFLLNRGSFHGEGIVSTLEMLVAQDGAAHDGKIRIGTHEIMGEHPGEVQELLKGGAVDLHGDVLGIEDDAVLVVVDIRAILQTPVRAADLKGNDAVVCPGGMVHPSGVALVLFTQLALGVGSLGGVLGGGDGLGVLFGLAEVDGDIHLAILGRILPAHILGNAIAADVVGIAAELVVPVRSLNGILGVEVSENADDLPGHGSQGAHDAGVENVPRGDAVVT